MTSEVELEEDGPVGPENIDDIEDLDDLEDLDDIDDGDGDSDVALDDEDVLGDDTLDVVAVVVDGAAPKAAKVAAAADPAAETETDDDELLADEVEASLDVILAERLRGEDTEDDEPDDEEDDAPNQLATVIPVRRPEEFLCQSCFLLKPPGQLADADHQLCRDCA